MGAREPDLDILQDGFLNKVNESCPLFVIVGHTTRLTFELAIGG